MGIVGKFLNLNIKNNIKNYLDMLHERRGFSREELVIIIKEFNEYLDYDILDEYNDKMDSLLNMTSEEVDSSLKDIHSLDEFN